MTIVFNKNDYKYEIESVVKLFFPAQSFTLLYDVRNADGDACFTQKKIGRKNTYLFVCVRIGDIKKRLSSSVSNDAINYENSCELGLARLLFLCLKKLTGIAPKWGLITGIRPVKRVNFMLEQGFEKSEIERVFCEKYLVKKEKFDLAYSTAKTQEKLLNQLNPKSFSLYVSIPFCPSRCSYCSFISQDVKNAKGLIPKYIENLCKEIRYTGEVAKRLNLSLDTVYFGGGTPTAIEDFQLEMLMKTISESFDLSNLREYTVEAGRADTINEEKLLVIKSNGATRISINPQTFNDSVLREIGRNHTSQQVIDSFFLARQLGFDNINMDLIAGLPTDTLESFMSTIDKVIKLNPDNITVHTLSIKRCADLINASESVLNNPVEKMLDYSSAKLVENGYSPYYLYRQKNTLGNLENTGYSKQGKESLYNIYIMEEIQTILAVGAGASTKLVDKNNGIERIFNYKFPLEYNKHFDIMLEKKQQILAFYDDI